MPPKSHRRTAAILLTVGCGFVLLLVGAFLTGWFRVVDHWQWQGRLADEQRLAQAVGIYTSEADFSAAYEPYGQPEATAIVTQLLQLPAVQDTDFESIDQIFTNPADQPLTEVRAFVSRYRAVLPLAERLSGYQRLVYSGNPYFNDARPHASQYVMLLAVHALLSRAVLADREGRHLAATQDFNRAWRIGHLLASEPRPLGAVTGLRAANQATRTIGRLGVQSPVTTHGPRAQERLRQLQVSVSVRPAIEGSVYGLTSSLVLRSQGQTDNLPAAVDISPNPNPLLGIGTPEGYRAAAARTLHEFRLRYEALLDSDSAFKAALEIMDLAEQERGERRPENSLLFIAAEATSYPVLVQVPRLMEGAKALHQARVAVALFREQSGRYPASSNEVAGFPLDPLTGKPIGYAATPAGFRVWMAGPDGVDDGGITRRESESRPRRNGMRVQDIVLEYDGSKWSGGG